MFQAIKRLFGGSPLPNPAESWKLDATDQDHLSRSLRQLPVGERGWITFSEARALFSTAETAYAFGQSDHEGGRKIAIFAAQHSSDLNFMPVEARVYFIKQQS
jgi:hypothetical protein